jgi:DNA-binding transcriptional LysR family regulator
MTIGYTLAQLQYFCMVAELGSFSAAASAQHVSANAVSSAITALEESLGTKLCVRRRAHGVALTSSGQILYGQAKDVLARAEELFLSVADDDTESVRPISLGCDSALASTVLVRLVETFAKRHPRVALKVVVDPQDVLVGQLCDGELDCAILYDSGLPTILEKRELYRRTAHVVLSKQHRLSSRKSVNLRELAQDPLVLLDINPSRDYILRLIRGSGVTPDVHYEVSDREIAKALVARNLGYSVSVLDPVVDRNESALALVRVPIAPKPSDEAMVIAWAAASSANARVVEMVDIATQQVAHSRAWGG